MIKGKHGKRKRKRGERKEGGRDEGKEGSEGLSQRIGESMNCDT